MGSRFERSPFAVGSSNYNSYEGKLEKPLFTQSGYVRPTVDKCDERNGYPPGWKRNFSNQNRGRMKESGSVGNQSTAGSESMEDPM